MVATVDGPGNRPVAPVERSTDDCNTDKLAVRSFNIVFKLTAQLRRGSARLLVLEGNPRRVCQIRRGGEARNRTKPGKDHLPTTVLKTADKS
jgi:hypothetical protein